MKKIITTGLIIIVVQLCCAHTGISNLHTQNANYYPAGIYDNRLDDTKSVQDELLEIYLDSVYYYSWGDCWEVTQIDRYTHDGYTYTEIMRMVWDAYLDSFITEVVVKHTYMNGVIIKKEYEYNNHYTSEADIKYEYIYDGNLNHIITKRFEEEGESWELTGLDSMFYDMNGNKVYQLEKIYNNGFLITENFTECTYDGSGTLLSERSGTIESEAEVNNSKIEYTYTSGQLTESIMYFWNSYSSEWENGKKETWQYDNTLLIKKEIFSWTDSEEWQKDEIYEYVYDKAGNQTQEKYAKYIADADVFLPMSLERTNSNEDGNFYEFTEYSWVFHAWKKETKTIKFYRNPNIWNESISLCEGNTYTLLLYAGCPVNVIEKGVKGTLKVYPNPTTGQFYIRFNDLSENVYTLNVLSIDGKNVYSERFRVDSNNQDRTFTLTGVNSGLYLLRVQSGDLLYQGKIVVNRE